MPKKYKLLTFLWLANAFALISVAQPARKTAAPISTRTVKVLTEPQAKIWLDDLLRGATDESGNLVIKNIAPGAHRIRVRAASFKETTQNLLPTQQGTVKIALTKTTDEAELAFQEAENFLTLDREKAIVAYQKAISLRPKYAEAYVAMARVMLARNLTEDALAAIAGARKARPAYAEASAVEGRIYSDADEKEKAVASFKRAIAEGKGFQPEAHTGLGLLYRDRADGVALTGDFDNANADYTLAAAELRKAVTQLAGATDAIDVYQLLGDIYYKQRKYQEAINTYEEFLRVFPDTNEATTIRSLIVQTRKEMNGEQ